jgi:hypothetical protein
VLKLTYEHLSSPKKFFRLASARHGGKGKGRERGGRGRGGEGRVNFAISLIAQIRDLLKDKVKQKYYYQLLVV